MKKYSYRLNRIRSGFTFVLLAALLGEAVAQRPEAEIQRLFQLGRQKLREGKLQEADEVFKKILSLDPDSSDASLGLAESALLKERPKEAIPILDAVVRAAPSARAHFLLARAWSGIDANRSLPWLEKVFEESPENIEAWELWADIRTASGDYDDAIARLERQIRQSPRIPYLHFLLAQLCVNRGLLAKAEKGFLEAERLSPAESDLNRRAVYSLGYLYVSLGKLEEGERLLRKVLSQDSSHVPALTALSDLLVRTGRSEDAGRLLSRAREIAPSDDEVLLLLGQYDLKQKQWEEAAAILTGLLKERPDNLQAHFFLGQALKSMGRVSEAMEHFRVFDALKRKARAEATLRRRGLAVEGGK